MDKDPVQDENEIPLEEELFMTDQEYELMKHNDRTEKLFDQIVHGVANPPLDDYKTQESGPLDAFFNCMEQEDFVEMEKMIYAGVDLKKESSTGMKAIHFSIEMGNEKVFRYLINFYEDVNEKDQFGMTPLHYAVIQEHFGIIDELIKRKADLKIKDNDGSSPLDAASKDIRAHVEKCIEKYSKEEESKKE